MSIFCTKCKTSIKEGNKFCTQCGTKVDYSSSKTLKEEKLIILEYFYGKYLLWKTLLISILLIICSTLLNYILFETFTDVIILNTSNIFYGFTLIIFSIPIWNSATNFIGLHYFSSVVINLFTVLIMLSGIIILLKGMQ